MECWRLRDADHLFGWYDDVSNVIVPAWRGGSLPDLCPFPATLRRVSPHVPANVPDRHRDRRVGSGAICVDDPHDAGSPPSTSRAWGEQDGLGPRDPVRPDRRCPALRMDGPDQFQATSLASGPPPGIVAPDRDRSPGDPFLPEGHPDPRGEHIVVTPRDAIWRSRVTIETDSPSRAPAVPDPPDRNLIRPCRPPAKRVIVPAQSRCGPVGLSPSRHR